MSAPQTVVSRLDGEVAAHRLDADPAQRSAALRLDALREALVAAPSGVLAGLRAALPWIPASGDRTTPRGVYLWGGVGRGKTLLMDLFFASLKTGPAAGGSTSFAVAAERSHFHHFMRAVHGELGAIKQRADPLDIVAGRLAARSRVLCLDEFFVADIGDAMLLAGLLGALFARGVTLVTTSNLAPQDLYADGLQRQRFMPAIELLQSRLDVLHLDAGIDYRLRRLEQAPTYLDSRLPATPEALRKRFAAFAGDGAAGPVTLNVEGRPLRARDAGTGTAWFDFDELCEGPRSQNDYIEIARLYHTVFISGIPVFGVDDDDAARRFIMLIDEFYDRGVKIVVSAAAPPAALYRGERLGFAFERASSRLIEMQTQAYLAGRHRP